MQVTCPCGTRFDATSPRATYCSARCRKRGSRAGLVSAVPSPPPPAPRPSAPDDADLPSVVGAVIAELAEANALHTPSGLAACRLAQLIDAASPMQGSSVAAWVKELRAAIADARAASPAEEADPIDELGRRRAARHA